MGRWLTYSGLPVLLGQTRSSAPTDRHVSQIGCSYIFGVIGGYGRLASGPRQSDCGAASEPA
jgi:hypothetical protein